MRQILRPQTPEDVRVVQDTLSNLDLIYSAGLYDYLPDRVAVLLTKRLFGRLRPGGRMLLGNVVETPDCTWMMDYVVGWSLIYRDVATMRKLADGLAPARVGITRDATEHCIFLDVTKQSSP